MYDRTLFHWRLTDFYDGRPPKIIIKNATSISKVKKQILLWNISTHNSLFFLIKNIKVLVERFQQAILTMWFSLFYLFFSIFQIHWCGPILSSWQQPFASSQLSLSCSILAFSPFSPLFPLACPHFFSFSPSLPVAVLFLLASLILDWSSALRSSLARPCWIVVNALLSEQRAGYATMLIMLHT